MSPSHVELARSGFEAAARGDFAAIGELLDPNVKWHGGDPDSDTGCHNRGEALEFMRQAHRRGAIGELVDVIDAGDRVVVVMQPPAAEGEEPELRANLTTFRGGKVVEMVAYETPEEALAATR